MKLATDGGSPVRSTPLAPWPYFDSDEIGAATSVLSSGKVNYWTGSEGREFEKEFAASAGCSYGIAVANGTLALELALHALGVGAGDEVIVPARTFIASASACAVRGAIPVVADVDPESQTLAPGAIETILTDRTRAIVAVHLAGWPCDMDAINTIARKHGLLVIEDCAQAHGAKYKGRPVGSLGDAAAFSFCQDKIMTTGGEGGMLTTNSRTTWEKAWSYKDHGKSWNLALQPSQTGFRWLHETFGTNMRMTEMQAAIGRMQLRKLPQWVEQRRCHAELLSDGFRDIAGITITIPPEGIYHSFYKYYLKVDADRFASGWSRQRIIDAVNAEGIPCFSGSCSEIYLEKAFPETLRPAVRLPVAQRLGEVSLMFMVHPTLTQQDMEDTVAAVQKVARKSFR